MWILWHLGVPHPALHVVLLYCRGHGLSASQHGYLVHIVISRGPLSPRLQKRIQVDNSGSKTSRIASKGLELVRCDSITKLEHGLLLER